MEILILNIETSTKVCSVSLAKDGEIVLFKEESSDKYIHSEKLNLFIEDLFESSNYSLKDLNAICVSKGPGSYTGLRIGVSCAKGLCYALDIPLISIDSLSVLANGYLSQNKLDSTTLLVPMIDARRMEVYTASFDSVGKMVSKIAAKVIDSDSFQLEGKSTLIGDGAEKCSDIIPSNISVENFINSANGMVKISHQKFLEKQFENVAYFEPYYLKDFKAG